MIGHMLDKITETATDTVIDLELRGNRADCYGIIGIARESYAYYGGRFDIPKPKISLPKFFSKYEKFHISVESKHVNRFFSCLLSGNKVKQSPEWLKTRLRDYGMEAVNMIVDVTNYVMIETGMPLHAFDRSKILNQTFIIRSAKDSEIFETFDGTVLKLTSEDVIFAGNNGKIYGLAGIIGSKGSGIDDDTTDIFLECAGYDQKNNPFHDD